MLGTVVICVRGKVVETMCGRNPDAKYAITCGECDFRSKDYTDHSEMNDELNKYRTYR